jgi:hypothetical protein
MEMERARAARVAALEPPVPDIAQNLETIQKHRYTQNNIDQYSSTYYHIPRERIERADPNFHQVSNYHWRRNAPLPPPPKISFYMLTIYGGGGDKN